MANDRCLVDDPPRARRLFRRDVLLAAMGLAAVTAEGMVGDPWSWLAGMVVAMMLGLSLLSGFRRATTYRSGWLDGRAAMVGAMGEAMHRGMTMEEWLESELARDYAVMGLREEGEGGL